MMNDKKWGEHQPIDLNDITRHTNPLLWRIIVTPLKKVEKVGSLYLPTSSEKTQEYLNTIGIVVALGSKAYAGEFKDPNAPKVGDFVTYGKHCGIHERVVQENGEEYTFVILNESDIAGTLETLEGRKPSI